MSILPNLVPVDLSIGPPGRVLSVEPAALRFANQAGVPPSHDPESLPDFATLTSAQAQEMPLGYGPERTSRNGSDR